MRLQTKASPNCSSLDHTQSTRCRLEGFNERFDSFFFNRLFQCNKSIGDKRLCLIHRRQAGFIKSRHFPTNEMGTGGLLRLFFWQNSGSVSIGFSHISNGKFLIPLTQFSWRPSAKPFPYACALEPRRRFVTEAMPNFNLSIWAAREVMGAA